MKSKVAIRHFLMRQRLFVNWSISAPLSFRSVILVDSFFPFPFLFSISSSSLYFIAEKSFYLSVLIFAGVPRFSRFVSFLSTGLQNHLSCFIPEIDPVREAEVLAVAQGCSSWGDQVINSEDVTVS